jgi:hypothetical protein
MPSTLPPQPPPFVRQSSHSRRRHAAKIAVATTAVSAASAAAATFCYLLPICCHHSHCHRRCQRCPSFNLDSLTQQSWYCCILVTTIIPGIAEFDSMTRQRHCDHCRCRRWMLPWLSSILTLPYSFSLAGWCVTFVPPPPPSVLAASRSAATSRRTAASASHSPLICPGCAASSHAAAT